MVIQDNLSYFKIDSKFNIQKDYCYYKYLTPPTPLPVIQTLLHKLERYREIDYLVLRPGGRPVNRVII